MLCTDAVMLDQRITAVMALVDDVRALAYNGDKALAIADSLKDVALEMRADFYRLERKVDLHTQRAVLLAERVDTLWNAVHSAKSEAGNE